MIENLGIGIDIIEVSRFKRKKYEENRNFYKKIFVKSEINYCLKFKNSPEDILHANMQVLAKMKPYFYGKKDEGVSIEGSLMLGEGSLIKTGSRIKGPVIIGKNCLIESNTTIGQNTSIGNNSILSNCDIANSIIMKDCKIEGGFKIRRSIISSNSKIHINKKTKDEKVFLLGEGTKISY